MSGVRLLIIALCTLLGSTVLASARQNQLPPMIAQGASMDTVPVRPDDAVQRQQAMAANQHRQLEINRDMQKMAELTQELKDYLARAGQGVMSVEAIKKAEQIEKLAHRIKSKMKQVF
jgi:hypothetical protein